MGTANSTGYYSRGEVEDYRVVVDNTVLGMQLLSFDAETVNNSKVELTWSINEETGFMGYNAERSRNGTDWEQVAFIPATGSGTHQYEMEDNNPYTGNSFYRLKLNHANGPVRYSAIRPVKVTDISTSISLFPNPATDKVTITIAGISHQPAYIIIADVHNKSLYYQKAILTEGSNTIELPVQRSWPDGIYFIQVSTATKLVSKKLIIKR
jgi:hypothetical protein